jgi:hypothetical protein
MLCAQQSMFSSVRCVIVPRPNWHCNTQQVMLAAGAFHGFIALCSHLAVTRVLHKSMELINCSGQCYMHASRQQGLPTNCNVCCC